MAGLFPKLHPHLPDGSMLERKFILNVDGCKEMLLAHIVAIKWISADKATSKSVFGMISAFQSGVCT
jgi:hypothetical protein